MTTLSAASKQWMMRPADERFNSVAELHAAATSYKDDARRAEAPTSKLRVEAHAGDVYLMAKNDLKIDLTNWSFGQLSAVADAPASYLQRLPAELARDCLNDGLNRAGDRANLMLFRTERDAATRAESGMVTLRALTSPRYSRIWNADITSRLLELEAQGPWQPAPAAFDGSRGLYLGDRDMFAFMVDNDRRIFESLPGGGLSRGFFVSNSEVGSASFKITTFFYNYICGNHYVWGASGIKEVKIRHIGNADERAFQGELVAELKAYADGSAKEDELRIKKMTEYVIGKDLDDVLDTVMGLSSKHGLSRKMVTAGYELASERVDWYGAPNTMWGLAGGLTEIARDMVHADDRTTLETATGKLMEIAF
jgi:hypothetical protein